MRVVQEIKIKPTKRVADGVAEGKYSWVNPYIDDEHFGIKAGPSKEQTVYLLENTDVASSENVVWDMANDGFVPGDIHHLLGVGAAFPELQTKRPIVALSPEATLEISPYSKGAFCVGLWRRERKRCVNVFWSEDDWPAKAALFVAIKVGEE